MFALEYLVIHLPDSFAMNADEWEIAVWLTAVNTV